MKRIMLAGLISLVLAFQLSAVVMAKGKYDDISAKMFHSLKAQKTAFSMTVTPEDVKQLSRLMAEAVDKDDYIRNIVSGYKYTAQTNKRSSMVTFTVNYRETKQQTDQVKAKVKKIVTSLLKPNMTEYEKEKVIHDYIVLNVAYDTTLRKYSAYNALVEGKAVCQGYALLTYLMLKEAGLAVRIIEGTAGGESHAWNKVRVDGNWYNLDTTWNDPVPDRKGEVSYSYYNLTDKQLRNDHNWKAGVDEKSAAVDFASLLKTKTGKGELARTVAEPIIEAIGDRGIAGKPERSLEDAIKKIQAAIDAREPSVTVLYSFKDKAAASKGMEAVYERLNKDGVAEVNLAATKLTGAYRITFEFVYRPV